MNKRKFNYLLTHSVLDAAGHRPDHPAFICGNQSITFSQLAGQMDQLAHSLIASGLKKGDRVGIYLNRSLETAVAIYGILRAGGVYVPLDPNAPLKRIKFLLEDCQIEYLISQPAQRRSLKEIIAQTNSLKCIIGLDNDWPVPTISWEEVRKLPTDKPISVNIMGHDLAYIMYTSGSTGVPKGIMHTHHSGLSYAQLSAETYGLTENDRLGNHSPIHFDISTLGYFTAPLVKATTVIVPDAYTKLPASLSQLMEKEQLTVWYSVPLALIQLLHLGVLEDRDLSTLRWVLFAGETFPAKYLRQLMMRWPKARFSNIYGPAETNQCTYYHLDTPPETDAPIPLGQIWDNTQMLIVDENDQEVSPGQAGELLIRSATMMEGYWRRPDLSEKGFYEQEIIPGFPEKYYRTGDLVKQDNNGLLHFLGRKDQQIKTRGYRVELESVEGYLAAHDHVKEAAVFPYQNEKEEVLIIGVVLLHKPEAITEGEMLADLKLQLPWYALPQSIFEMTTFPRTGTGKIDRPGLKQNLLEKIKTIHG